jgi:hypothetical protein
MPYIEETLREKYDIILNQMPDIDTKGDLEYCLFKLLKRFMKTRAFKYSTLHEAVYSAMHVADEFRRRYLDVRENEAREKNGDVA